MFTKTCPFLSKTRTLKVFIPLEEIIPIGIMDVMVLMTVGLDVAIVHLKQFVPGYKSKYFYVPAYLLSTKK